MNAPLEEITLRLLQTILEGRMKEKRPQGQKRIRMVDNIGNGSAYAEMKRRAEKQEAWGSRRETLLNPLPEIPLWCIEHL